MAMEVTSGLFGGKPPSFNQEFAGAMQAFKGTTPTDIATGLSYAGASQLGRGLMQGFGVQDPEQADADMVKKMSAMLQQQGISTQTPEGMVKLAEMLNSQGRADLAEKAINYANVLKKAASEENLNASKARMYDASAIEKQQENKNPYVYKGDPTTGAITVIDKATGMPVRTIDSPTSEMLKNRSGGSAAPAAPGQPGKVAPKGRPPLTDPSLQR